MEGHKGGARGGVQGASKWEGVGRRALAIQPVRWGPLGLPIPLPPHLITAQPCEDRVRAVVKARPSASTMPTRKYAGAAQHLCAERIGGSPRVIPSSGLTPSRPGPVARGPPAWPVGPFTRCWARGRSRSSARDTSVVSLCRDTSVVSPLPSVCRLDYNRSRETARGFLRPYI